VVMNDEAVRIVASYECPKLLNSPFGGRVFGHVPVDETPGADIEHHEDEYEPEPGLTVTKKSHASTSRA
jgi:hypothetical protein